MLKTSIPINTDNDEKDRLKACCLKKTFYFELNLTKCRHRYYKIL